MKKLIKISLIFFATLVSFILLSKNNSSFAASGTCGDNATWDLTGSVLTISGYGDMDDYKLNGSYTNTPWVEYVQSVTPYDETYAIGSIVISDKITHLGDYAFDFEGTLINRDSLKQLTIPNSVTSIGRNCFTHSKLETISIPDTVESIGKYCFSYNYQLTSIKLPKNKKFWKIEEGLFFDCRIISSIEVPYYVLMISEYAFQNTTGLSSLKLGNKVISVAPTWMDQSFGKDDTLIIKYAGSQSEFEKAGFSINTNTTSVQYNIPYTDLDSYYNPNNSVHTHTWNNGAITTPATCTENGIKTYTCTGCSETKTETITTAGHSFDNGKITKEATYDTEGVKTYTCSKCGTTKTEKITKLTRTSIAKITTTGIKDKIYNGKKQTQKITVKLGNVTLKEGTDYTVTYKDNKKVGKATIVITGKGTYTGTINRTFKINPKGTSLKKLTAGKKQFKATWNKQATETTGYEIQYSTNKNFKSSKTSKIKKNKTTSNTIKSLKEKKKYYVRIRTYKTVNGKTYYSGWSKVKNITTKNKI